MTGPPLPDLSRLSRTASSAAVGISQAGDRALGGVGGAHSASIFRIASLTKPFTAAATVRAAARASVPLDTPVVEVLPGLASDWVACPGITITHLLSQTSGLAPVVTGRDVAALGGGDDALFEACRLVVAQGSSRAPGETWEYYNGNYFLAGAVTAALSRAAYETALSDLVLAPFVLPSTSFDPPRDVVAGIEARRPIPDGGYPRGRRPSGGLASSVADLLSFGEGLLSDRRLLDAVRTPRTRTGDPMRYGLGWAIGPSEQMYLNGRLPGYRAALLVLPADDFVAVGLANDTAALPAVAHLLSLAQRRLTGDELSAALEAFAE